MKIEFFEETNFSYRRKQDLEKDLNLHWIARNMAGDKGSRLLRLPVKRHR